MTLSDSQRAALTARLRRGRAAQEPIPRRVTGDPGGPWPLSFGQEQLWVIDRLAPCQATYNVPLALRLAGLVNVAALQAALDALAARHESLRTRFLTGEDGEPVQVIDPPAAVNLATVNLGAADLCFPGQDQREGALRELITAESLRPFDLAAGPLFRVSLIRLGPVDQLLLANLPHAIFDGWSARVLLADLAALYRAEVTGEPSGLAELAVRYADYAVWERERLSRARTAELEGYWREALAGLPAVRFPADRPRPVPEEFGGGLAERLCGRELLGQLRELGQAHGTTLFVVLMAGLLALLHRYTGQDDLVVGTVTANRSRPELAPLIGYLVNTLPIRVNLSADPPFGELLTRVHAAVIGAYAHQELPFSQIVTASRVARVPGRAPAFQIALTYAERDRTPIRAGGVDFALSDVIVGINAAKFDLDFSAEARDEGLWVECSYKTSLFDEGTATRILRHYEVMLAGAAADPGSRVSALPLLTAAETDRELRGLNDTQREFPVVCVHEGFERQAARTPDAIAAVCGNQEISYSGLGELADRVAAALRGRGVGPECLVGVCMETGIPRLGVLLGIWKAGGGYVPLDPLLPAERLRFLIADTSMTMIVTDAASGPRLPATGAPAVLAGELSGELSGELPGQLSGELPEPPHLPGARPQNVAYVIYTSGSTGQPKGVLVEHRQVANFLYAMTDAWGVSPNDRVLQFASLSFDASVQEMFMPLLAGGRTVLAPPDVLHTPSRLAALMREQAVTFACLTPSVAGLLEDAEFPDLRVLMCGGEELPGELVGRWLRPGLKFVNDYGPTETAITAVCAELHDAVPAGQSPPLGHPIPNCRAYVLDHRLRPVPAGVTGELHLSGAGVARGYLGRPGMTSARFIADPFRPGGRLYKTGDLCRRRADGSIVYLGRADHQVKLRGLRVEPGEIEAALRTHPSVAQAVVIVTSAPGGDKQLTAYLHAPPGLELPAGPELRGYLSARLPSYMVPARFVAIGEFPLNSSGKIDRNMLPEPEPEPALAEASPGESRGGGTAALLGALFGEVLHREPAGPDEGFFDLGGNSLQVMRLVDLIARRASAEVSPSAVLLHPTPRELATQLGTAMGNGPLVPLSREAGGPLLVLIHAIGGAVTDYGPLAAALGRSFEVRGLAAGQPAHETLAGMVSEYAKILGAAVPRGPCLLGGWSMGGVLAYEVARALEASGRPVALLVLLDPPYAVPPGGEMSGGELAGQFVADVLNGLGRASDFRAGPGGRETGEQLDWLAGQLGVAADQVRQRFEVFAAHCGLLAGYTPAASARVTAPALLVTARRSLNATAASGWYRHLGGPVQTFFANSDHYEILRPPLASDIAAAVARWGQTVLGETR
ncbi:MAG TPA: amino acid adenylation domain-containing protein [Streptosporangiaceae bacterium]|nr:amino acid adenylation domain-containing protein [Streptosporangiaceae bacterium]